MIEIALPRIHLVGMGEVGQRLAGALGRAGIATHPVTRTRGWDEARDDSDGLCLVCVREESLAEVLETLHNVPSDRLVLIQNGWIRPLLHDLPDVTRGLLWFTAKGEFFQILRPNRFSGPHASELALALAAGGLPSEAAEPASFDEFDADKMGFNCVVGLPLAIHGLSLGEYLERLPDEARAVFEEAVQVCSTATSAKPTANGWGAFLESAAHLDWVRVADAKALGFRNGAVAALAAEHGLSAPVNSALLQKYGEMCAKTSDRDVVL
jgi:ketopantoate reductase